MLKLLSLSALTSAVVLATAALTPASAGRFGGHSGGGGHYNFRSMGGHYRYMGHRPRLSANRYPHQRYSGRWAYWRHHHHYGHWRYGSYGWAGYYGGYDVPVDGAVTYPAASPAPVCTCLTKEYLDDGAVRFTDTCTKETAVSMPVPGPRG